MSPESVEIWLRMAAEFVIVLGGIVWYRGRAA